MAKENIMATSRIKRINANKVPSNLILVCAKSAAEPNNKSKVKLRFIAIV